jgi:hypothetical protein
MKTNYKAIAYFVVAVVGIVAYIALCIFVIVKQPREKRIDCTWAEISPDIPIKAKEECRKLKMENIK